MNYKLNFAPGTFLKAIKDADEGRIGVIDVIDSTLDPEGTKPIDGYLKHIQEHGNGKKFPDCCIFHGSLTEYADGYYNTFPNCCDAHKLLLTTKWFRKKDYEYLPPKLIDAISYTEYHISQKVETEDWYNDITEYIEYTIESFGKLPNGFGPPVGLESYCNALRIIIDSYKEVESEKKQKLIAYFTPSGLNGLGELKVDFF